VLASLTKWFDHRTGYRTLVRALLIEHIPGGAKWRYVWGSTLAFVFGLQLITGLLLMTAYSAGDSTAWSSVYFIQYQMDFGWLIRGLHHFGSGTMVVLLGLHMLQVVIAGAHLPPREINWWLGLALLGLVLAMSLTGYLLPWDQKGYWATQVATNIAGNLPFGIGPFVQKIVVGGPAYGHHTLTRFYALHVGVIPPLMIVLIVAHLVVFRRHGVTVPFVTIPRDEEGEPLPEKGDGWFWPDQAFRDMVVSMAIFAVLLSLILWGHGHKVEPAANAAAPGLYERWAHAGQEGRGANLDAPADPGRPYPARPEWYFLSLFQLLKYFKGDQEIIGTVLIPNAALLLLAVLPLLGYGWMRRFGHVFGIVVIVGLLGGAVALTCLAIADDMVYPLARKLLILTATRLIPLVGLVFLLQLGILSLVRRGKPRTVVYASGVVVLAALGLGTAGAAYLAVQTDHEYTAFRKSGSKGDAFAAKTLRGPLKEQIENQMTEEDKEPRQTAEKILQEQQAADLLAERAIALASAGIPAEGAIQLLRRDPRTKGKELFGETCATCHTYRGEFEGDKASASDLAGWGTRDWVRDLLRNPDDPRFFGRTKLTTMGNWVKRTRKKLKPDEAKALDAEFDTIADWLGNPNRGTMPEAFKERCNGCHTYKGEGGGDTKGPDFTGYASADWLRLMLMAPAGDLRYGSRNAMPAFRDLEGPTAEVTRQEMKWVEEHLRAQAGEDKKAEVDKAVKMVHLSDVDRELIIRWLLKENQVVFGGEPIAPPKR
jgi:ubiquinol-cytochrome c reductase cytochrome b subunit